MKITVRGPLTFHGLVAKYYTLNELALIALLYKNLNFWTAYADVEWHEMLDDALCRQTTCGVYVHEWTVASQSGLSVPHSGRVEQLMSIGLNYEGYAIIVG